MVNTKGIFQPKNITYYTGVKWVGDNFDDVKELFPNTNLDENGALMLTTHMGTGMVPMKMWVIEEPVGNGGSPNIHVLTEDQLEEKFNVVGYFEELTGEEREQG